MSDNTPNHLQPWECVNSAELKALRQIAQKAKQLQRGCWCEYDYRCGNCQTIVDLMNLSERLP